MAAYVLPCVFVYLIAALLYYNLRVFLRTAAFEMLSFWDCVQSHAFGSAVMGLAFYVWFRNW